MKKHEAKELMKQGKKITHTWFTPDEWMTIEDSELLFEDGIRCSQTEFWEYRTHSSWNDGYSLYSSNC